MPPSPNSDLPSMWPSPRISFSYDAVTDPEADPTAPIPDRDFEFRLAGPSSMLPADQLFSGGKLVPLHSRPEAPHPKPSPEPFDPSPRAPTCSIRWRDLLALKAKLHRKASTTPEIKKTSISSPNPKSRSLNQRTESTSIQPTLSLPLLRSSSLGEDCEESLRMKVRKRRAATRPRGVSVESPRMNSSGRVVFHGLERSSSGGNGGARIQVRVRPVINVPVGSLVGGNGGGHSKSVSVLGVGIHGSRRKAMQLGTLKL
ncbi:hypothetical protein J5N97_028374 [Dioscorea zingiberensis]|uniref:Uncharacterized protein n=1 Tax=Dioscorea zingiberensis TaxID=325984 RepID=A0A9D5BZC3_9LILI|nr:hypothetical protein J5N97_028374 [Dioscorea zingiberensis]